jgi:hypothetical protein
LQFQSMCSFLFGSVWTINAISFILHWHNPGLGFCLFMGMFVLIGVAMTLAPLRSYREGKRTLYAVTDKRLLILVKGNSLNVQSYSELDVSKMERTERPNGTGDIVIAKKQAKESDGDIRSIDVKFLGIPDVRSVETLIKSTFTK